MNTISLTKDEEMQELVKKFDVKHIAIIMDGNRRWAKQRFLPGAAGHSEGRKSLRKTVRACSDWGIECLTVYAFSTENWGRKPDEVDFLMKLFAETIKGELFELNKNNVQIKIIGDMTRLNPDLQQIFKEAEDETSKNDGLNFQLAINYGARDEIKNAVKLIAQDAKNGKINPEDITEETISSYLYTKNLPDPDLLIRTGGEKRLSNYLLWQIAYSEFFVTEVLWPDFNEDTLADAIQNYANRNRRFGKD